MNEELFVCEPLKNYIHMTRDYNQLLQEKSDVADAMCGIDMAMNEVCTDRVKELLHTARTVVVGFHYLLDMMAVDKPKITEL